MDHEVEAVVELPSGSALSEVILQSQDETDDAAKNKSKKSKKTSRILNFRKSFQLPAVVLLTFVLPAASLYGLSLLASTVITLDNPCSKAALNTTYTSVTFVLQNVLVFVLFPIGGWLSDTKIGRFRIIYISLWLFWLGVGLMGLGVVLFLLEPCHGPVYIMGKYVCNITALVVIAVGAAGFFPNILVFIIDQLIGASSAQIRSYILWFVWILYVGFFFSDWMTVASQVSPTTVPHWMPIPIIVVFVAFSIVVIATDHFRHIFNIFFLQTNPYSTVCGILIFASRHKYPVNRSAFTYSDDSIPSRIDLAKSKYGGPYSQETVECVKTLLSMLVLYVSMLPFFVGYSGPINQIIPFIQHLQTNEDNVSVWFVYLADSLITIVAIPLLELVILPFLPKFEYVILRPLRWMFIGMISLTLANISLLVIDVIAHQTDRETHVSCFINWDIGSRTLSFDFNLVVISSLLWGICDLLITTSTFIFICSQAPYNLRGMLLGLFMFMQGLFQAIGNTITALYGDPAFKFPVSCGLVYWSTLSLFSIFGCIIFLFAARSYHNRVRDEVDSHRQLIEDVFERRIQAGEVDLNSRESSNLSAIGLMIKS